MLAQVLAQAHAHHARLQAETGPLVLAFEDASEALKDGDLSLPFLPAPLKLVAERRQRAVIDKSIQAAQQARGRSERGALAGAAAAPLCPIALTPSCPRPAAKQSMRSLESEVCLRACRPRPRLTFRSSTQPSNGGKLQKRNRLIFLSGPRRVPACACVASAPLPH